MHLVHHDSLLYVWVNSIIKLRYYNIYGLRIIMALIQNNNFRGSDRSWRRKRCRLRHDSTSIHRRDAVWSPITSHRHSRTFQITSLETASRPGGRVAHPAQRSRQADFQWKSFAEWFEYPGPAWFPAQLHSSLLGATRSSDSQCCSGSHTGAWCTRWWFGLVKFVLSCFGHCAFYYMVVSGNQRKKKLHWVSKYSNHLNSQHLNTGFIWILDSMDVQYSNG